MMLRVVEDYGGKQNEGEDYGGEQMVWNEGEGGGEDAQPPGQTLVPGSPEETRIHILSHQSVDLL